MADKMYEELYARNTPAVVVILWNKSGVVTGETLTWNPSSLLLRIYDMSVHIVVRSPVQ